MYNDIKTVDRSNAKDTMFAKERNKQKRGRMLVCPRFGCPCYTMKK